ncbi:MAG TPA: amidase, partial [Terriglobales bacterium]|nr:amidase [Terriglobales bacterium]
AADLGRRIGRREILPLEIVEAMLERIGRLDPALNAFRLVTPERARDEARAAEREILAGRARGPLHGVPYAPKDIFDTAGLTTTAGAKILAANVPARDAAVIERARAAGLVLLGKTNMHEFAYGVTSNNPHFGPCRNPWDPGRSPGGSSGGSGAALAAGLCALSLGTDTGGSIRIPAGACGIVGLKPTLGRVSRRGVTPLSWSLDTVGPMARTVEDAALLLAAIAGADPEDPWCADAPAGDFTRDLEAGARGLAIGVPREWFFAGVEPAIEAAVRAAIAVLGREGARIVEVSLPDLADAHTAAHATLAAEASAWHEPWLRERPDDYGADVRRALELGHLISAVDYVNARRMQEIVRARALAALAEADVLAMPTLPRTPPAVGEAVSREPEVAWNRFMTPWNLTGFPAISIPCGFEPAGLPIGLQIVGRPFEAARVLRAARAYERATDWHERRPALAMESQEANERMNPRTTR